MNTEGIRSSLAQGLTRIVQKHQLRAVPTGNVEILDKFWNLPAEEKTELVPPLLVYADLMATLDPRNLEIAKQIKEKYVKGAPHPA